MAENLFGFAQVSLALADTLWYDRFNQWRRRRKENGMTRHSLGFKMAMEHPNHSLTIQDFEAMAARGDVGRMIAWLQWNDPNGDYDPHPWLVFDSDGNYQGSAATEETARALAGPAGWSVQFDDRSPSPLTADDALALIRGQING